MSDADDLARRLARGPWNYEDFLQQLHLIRRLGPLRDVFRMIPQLKELEAEALDEDLEPFRRMLEVMTEDERKIPELMEGARGLERRKRVAEKAGVDEKKVERFTRTFFRMGELLSRLAKESR